MHHDDSAVIDGEPAEALLELIPVTDDVEGIGMIQVMVTGQLTEGVSIALAFAIAGMDKEAIAPSLEAFGVS